MKKKVREVLEERWRQGLQALQPGERERLMETVPRVGEYYRALDTRSAS
ncbi:hypothetical protein O4J56_29140 [Nocardiopsis sp. RSe5-2]|uniref:MarR family transcriptional regulator n=1 Tax=Nocardiopsis endophytica TaxID=3018445 RepID=A0ABT4UEG5_9ACTN|nr:hypothetical protein [Nocardiopsis endophytica]MDA2814745.1 hypothetical protein [Nocardiopsis endophytica]